MTDLMQIGEELRRIERDRQDRRVSQDRALTSLLSEPGAAARGAERFADRVVFWSCVGIALILMVSETFP